MDLDRYIIAHSGASDPLLQWVEQQTHYHTVHPRMLSGRPVGDFLTFLSSVLRPFRILELGTFTGYSAICLAKGLAPGGRLDTLEINDELEEPLNQTFERAALPIRLLLGSALDILPTLTDSYDLIYIDADKREYPQYYPLCKSLLSPRGVILADNVLWGGKVVDPTAPRDAQTRGIMTFNDLVQTDMEVQNVLLPVSDGMMFIRRI